MDYTIERRAMTCGSYEAESRKYHLHLSKGGKRYLVADVPNCAGYVYVEGDANSDGFGGRTLSFELVSGEIIKLKGPWHTNSEDLFRATGVDVRDKHLTFGCISKERGSTGNPYHSTIMQDVLYIDKEPTIGPFERIRDMAQRMADERNETLYYYSESESGSSNGPVKPNQKKSVGVISNVGPEQAAICR